MDVSGSNLRVFTADPPGDLYDDAIESLNATVSRAVRARGHFTSVGAAKRLMYLALREAQCQMDRAHSTLQSFKREFAIHFDERFNPSKEWISR